MELQNKADIRTGRRWPFQAAIQVSCPTNQGAKTVRAKCLDISEQGVRIECSQPIEARTNVFMQAPEYGLMGNAWVRYCRRSGARFVVGLLFASPLGEADPGRRRCLKNASTAESEGR